MGKVIELTGRRFGRLKVISARGVKKGWGAYWSCLCDCGNSVEVRSQSLRQHRTRSCGCLHKETAQIQGGMNGKKSFTHRMTSSREYKSYTAMKERCLKESHKSYPRYGGRGITICDRWLAGFEFFYKDMGDRPERMTLDRIDNDEGYSPGNCRWATLKEQGQNQGTTKLNEQAASVIRYLFNSKSKTARELASAYKISPGHVRRVAHGVTWGLV